MTFTSTPKGFAESAPDASKAFKPSAAPSPDGERAVFIAKRKAETAQHIAPSTKAELDRLNAQRATPAPQLTLEPSGSVKRSVDQAQRSQDEERARFIQARLKAAQSAHTRQFKLSR